MGIGYGNAVLCNGCGAPLSFEEGQYSVECEYCKVKNTRPTLITPEKQAEYDQAVSLRKQGEFDKAATIFSKLIADFGTVSEFYWEMLMCNYGIIFVEDPNSPNRNIPTMVKKKDTFIIDDSDYRSAVKYAPDDAKEAYREIAGIIDDYQRKYFKLQSEKPYDVFISYKVQDSVTKEKTEDSKIAYEIYRTLNKAGYRVFLSEVTLESKMGEEYEPYIFNALTSAKVLIVVGTKREYVESTWVKNEWNRFLMLMRSSDRVKRTIIPVYRDVDPYDLPRELYAKQAVNAANLGFETGILKYIDNYVAPENDSHLIENMQKQLENIQRGGNPQEMLKGVETLMNNNVYNDELFKQIDRILELDPGCSKAYWYRALASQKINTRNVERSFVDVLCLPDVGIAMNLGTDEEKLYYLRVGKKCHENIAFERDYAARISKLSNRYIINQTNTKLHQKKAEIENAATLYGAYFEEKSQPVKTLVNTVINGVGIALLLFWTVKAVLIWDNITVDYPWVMFFIGGLLAVFEITKLTANKVLRMVFAAGLSVPIMLLFRSDYEIVGLILLMPYVLFFLISGIVCLVSHLKREKMIKKAGEKLSGYEEIIDEIIKRYTTELQEINQYAAKRSEELNVKIDYVKPDYYVSEYKKAKKNFVAATKPNEVQPGEFTPVGTPALVFAIIALPFVALRQICIPIVAVSFIIGLSCLIWNNSHKTHTAKIYVGFVLNIIAIVVASFISRI